MQAGPKFEERPIRKSIDRREDFVELARMRCPNCNRLYSVEMDSLVSLAGAGVTRAEFSCSQKQCGQVFGVQLPLTRAELSRPVLPTFALMTAVSLETPPSVRRSPQPQHQPRPQSRDVDSRVAVKAPLKKDIKQIAYEHSRECPRCQSTNDMKSTECVRCGVVFEHLSDVNIEEEISLGGSKELFAAWNLVIEDYEDRIRHERFLELCRRERALSYGAKKYSQILVSAPHDLIARQMRNKIVALVSSQAENSNLPTHLNLRIPKFNQMALFLASILFFVGMMAPGLERLMHLGAAMIALTLSVRLMMRAPL